MAKAKGKAGEWKTKSMSPKTLQLDGKNPRLGRELTGRAPREIIQYLFEHDKAMEVAESIATRGYFVNEPLLATYENGQCVVIEGNRRLAALKALLEPGLLDGPNSRKVERFARNIKARNSIESIPVTLAPNRKSTDQLVAGRHVGTPVLAWRSENRASFILDKLAEGYDTDSLRDELGFTSSDIQAARQTRAVADLARTSGLPEEISAKLEGPTAKVFSTIERVLDSTPGREFLHLKPDLENGFRVDTTQKEFMKAFRKLVSDLALKKQSSRSLNTNDNIEAYLSSWKVDEKPKKKRGSFVPSDAIGKSPVSSRRVQTKPAAPRRSLTECKTVIPKDFRLRYADARLLDIWTELRKLKRDEFPNASAVLLRVFLELSIIYYLKRIGKYPEIIRRLKDKDALRHPTPTLRQLAREMKPIVEENLPQHAAEGVLIAIQHNPEAPFTISELNRFVHSSDFPTARDIQQFWSRTEPLFRMMLEEDAEEA